MTEKIDGLAQLDLALSQLSKATARNTLIRAGSWALVPFVAVTRALAPSKSDWYRHSWKISTKLNKHQKKGVRSAGKNFAEVYAGTTNPGLGVILEYGTPERRWLVKKGKRKEKRGTGTGKSTGAVRPHPHARPAWEASKKEVLNLVRVALWEEIANSLARSRKR